MGVTGGGKRDPPQSLSFHTIARVTGPAGMRGFPVVGTPDIGAYESGTDMNYNTYVWETITATPTPLHLDPTHDFDADGANNRSEWIAGTKLDDPASVFRFTQTTSTNTSPSVSFGFTLTTVPGRNYFLESSTDLINWSPFASFTGTGATESQTGLSTGTPKFFLRAKEVK